MDEAQRLCDRVAIISEGKVIAEGNPLDLIATHLAPETVELDCSPEEEFALLNGIGLPIHRLRAGGRIMIYLSDATPLIELIRGRDQGDRRALVVRPTNLEDVFLAMTGTSLESGL
jgi:lipooligosaccharide transport system ATP-binding protein